MNINEAYSNFMQKLISVIGEIARHKSKWENSYCEEWFDSVVPERINNRDKLFNKLKNSRLLLH